MLQSKQQSELHDAAAHRFFELPFQLTLRKRDLLRNFGYAERLGYIGFNNFDRCSDVWAKPLKTAAKAFSLRIFSRAYGVMHDLV